MAKPGPAAAPSLSVVREGNPGHHPTDRITGGLRVEALAPTEPDWRQWWPPVKVPTRRQLQARHSLQVVEGQLSHIEDDAKRQTLVEARQQWLIERDLEQAQRAQKVARRAREVARNTWRRIVPILDQQGLLSTLDATVLVDLCTVVARLDECERNISELGIWQRGERGAMKNPATTVAGQLRQSLRFYIGQLGLSPVARDVLNPQSGDDGDDEFD